MSNMKDAFNKAGYRSEQPEAGQQSTVTAKKIEPDANYAKRAETVISQLKYSMGRDYQNLTTSKIRNTLTLVSEIYNDVVTEYSQTLSPELQSRIEYLKVRLVYECGREERTVKPFVERAGLLAMIDGIGDSRDKFIKFARYMEALVAYHRFYGGKEY